MLNIKGTEAQIERVDDLPVIFGLLQQMRIQVCQATIRFTRRRQLEMPMAKPHDLDLVTG